MQTHAAVSSTAENAHGYAATRWAGDLCFFAGMIATPEHLGDDVTDQANDIFKQVQDKLADEGLTLEDVISVTGYLSDPRDFASYDKVWRSTFPATHRSGQQLPPNSWWPARWSKSPLRRPPSQQENPYEPFHLPLGPLPRTPAGYRQ